MAKQLHPSITLERIEQAYDDSMTSLDYPGFCLACGERASGVEPDAEGYECESCGEHAVEGIEYIVCYL